MGRSLIVEADGGSRGNPGVAGYGALVRDAHDRSLLAERAAPLGKASNNVAEYQGLIAGLLAAEAIDAGADIVVRMDSRLVVEQMAGRWKIKHEDMRRLAGEAQEVLRRIRAAGGSVEWTWIPRAQNKAADKLSNDGMDGKDVERDLWRDEAAGADSGQTEPTTQESRPSLPKRTVQTRLILLRHGVTDFTVGGRLDGRGGADPQLNAEGLDQAEKAGAALAELVTGPVSVVTSSLARARQTGAAAARVLGVQPEIDADWDEQCFGVWDGLSFVEIGERYPGDPARMRVEDDFRVEGGETHAELVERVDAARERAIARGGTVVIATHRMPILVVLRSLLGLSFGHAWLLAADPASLTEIDVYADGSASVAYTNDTHHLR
ncbi:bifunctional RNase H/acid phosphatase [Flexivirga endophytica]|uniref:Bifunctional RNase H/acid phosphatase n=1 Tax=Flexivirga endophytica TaxID=1849103 RepID=A0A916TEU1_9MICO|nr:bifunctional RNase H/acid phosphatase [Flexivirga endophytica]GGB41742.1 bifunctional RNase H/acid phosphatase [Flexivirga endophytica]GHB69536.1 bifunctional RNase H/acid phosphatase [Flexivirga endophytica]